MPCTCQQTKGGSAQSKTASAPSSAGAKPSSSAKTTSRPAFLSIRYSGPTGTTATGTSSGRQYKFTRTGAVLQVDPADKGALLKVPHLRQI